MIDPELEAEAALTAGTLILLPAGHYTRVRVLSVHDGDTLWVLIPVAVKLRLDGIDAPELATPRGPAARDYLAALVIDKDLELDLGGNYKYGGERMGSLPGVIEKMIAAGHATPWDGRGERPGSKGAGDGDAHEKQV